MRFRSFVLAAGLLFTAPLLSINAACADWISAPYFAKDEQDGKLPPISERLPEHPAVAEMSEQGQQGGELKTLLNAARDTRQISYYSYARLVC